MCLFGHVFKKFQNIFQPLFYLTFTFIDSYSNIFGKKKTKKPIILCPGNLLCYPHNLLGPRAQLRFKLIILPTHFLFSLREI